MGDYVTLQGVFLFSHVHITDSAVSGTRNKTEVSNATLYIRSSPDHMWKKHFKKLLVNLISTCESFEYCTCNEGLVSVSFQRPSLPPHSPHALKHKADSPQAASSQWQRFCLFQRDCLLT